jgi:predicted DCC family thiol-disulfide oxidoreductase YuxK
MGKAGSNVARIVLFDGVCGLCSHVVQFIIRRDRKGIFQFAALQSDSGQQLLKRFGLPPDSMSSFLLVEGDRCYMKSTAALRVCLALPGLWPVLYILSIVPRPLRDGVYDWVARNRYRWFGRKDACMLPTAEQRGRFLP